MISGRFWFRGSLRHRAAVAVDRLHRNTKSEKTVFRPDSCERMYTSFSVPAPLLATASLDAYHGSHAMFEFACSPNSSMGNVFKDLDIPHVRLAKEYIDLESAVAGEQLAYQLSQCVRPNLWAAIPCVSGSPWQRLNLHRLGKPFKKKLEEKVKQSKVIFSKFALHAEHVLKAGGSVTFEWPRDCEGWQRPEM